VALVDQLLAQALEELAKSTNKQIKCMQLPQIGSAKLTNFSTMATTDQLSRRHRISTTWMVSKKQTKKSRDTWTSNSSRRSSINNSKMRRKHKSYSPSRQTRRIN